MWYINRVSKAQAELVASVLELLQSTSRNLILIIACLYAGWHFVATLTWPEKYLFDTWFVTLVVIPTCTFSLWLLPKHLLIAQAV